MKLPDPQSKYQASALDAITWCPPSTMRPRSSPPFHTCVTARYSCNRRLLPPVARVLQARSDALCVRARCVRARARVACWPVANLYYSISRYRQPFIHNILPQDRPFPQHRGHVEHSVFKPACVCVCVCVCVCFVCVCVCFFVEGLS